MNYVKFNNLILSSLVITLVSDLLIIDKVLCNNSIQLISMCLVIALILNLRSLLYLKHIYHISMQFNIFFIMRITNKDCDILSNIIILLKSFYLSYLYA